MILGRMKIAFQPRSLDFHYCELSDSVSEEELPHTHTLQCRRQSLGGVSLHVDQWGGYRDDKLQAELCRLPDYLGLRHEFQLVHDYFEGG